MPLTVPSAPPQPPTPALLATPSQAVRPSHGSWQGGCLSGDLGQTAEPRGPRDDSWSAQGKPSGRTFAAVRAVPLPCGRKRRAWAEQAP